MKPLEFASDKTNFKGLEVEVFLCITCSICVWCGQLRWPVLSHKTVRISFRQKVMEMDYAFETKGKEGAGYQVNKQAASFKSS